MSFYNTNFLKYKLTHHSIKRLKERIFKHKDINDDFLLEWINDILEFSTVDIKFENGDISFLNLNHNIKVIVTKENIIKTILKI